METQTPSAAVTIPDAHREAIAAAEAGALSQLDLFLDFEGEGLREALDGAAGMAPAAV